jgi:hypothetical protein
MGSYYELSIAHFVMDTGKAHLPEYVMIPFRREDNSPRGYDSPLDGEREQRQHVYRADAETIGRRLDLLGFSLPTARRAYTRGLARVSSEERAGWPERLAGPNGFDEWLDAMKSAINAARRLEHVIAHETTDQRLTFMLSWDDHMLGFPLGQPELVLRAILAVAEPSDEVVLDFHDLVAEGYVADDDNLWVLDAQQPMIVVTEGKSDSRLLGSSLRLLHPGLARFLAFIDFETVNARGGTDELVQFVRMFIGCGIRNRIVVLFDNDAAGNEALQRLLEARLPDHVFAMTLPPLESARTYPTLGPAGPSPADINGRACSLELYLGDDVLRDASGERLPIRWTGFNDRLQTYQGQITDKSGVQKRFSEKLREAAADPTAQARFDFAGVRAIFQAILFAVAAR